MTQSCLYDQIQGSLGLILTLVLRKARLCDCRCRLPAPLLLIGGAVTKARQLAGGLAVLPLPPTIVPSGGFWKPFGYMPVEPDGGAPQVGAARTKRPAPNAI